MTATERREPENWAQCTRLSEIETGGDLRFLSKPRAMTAMRSITLCGPICTFKPDR